MRRAERTLKPGRSVDNLVGLLGFTHAALGSQAISTLTQAVRRGYLHSSDCLGRRPSFQRLDNETSAPLESFATDNNITIQYCPPHTHRSLKAERAIHTFKNHFIATLCTAAPDFPLTLWDDMLPQMVICLNHLIPYAPNVTVSAYAGLHGEAFDFAKHPIAPIGTRILIYDKPTARA